MYTPEEFDEKKSKVMNFIMYKKRTENEIRKKFKNSIDENMLEDIIEYLKEAGYINDKEYIKKLVNEYMTLKNMSIREIKNKVYQKGVYIDDIEDYLSENMEELIEYELKSAEKLAQKKKDIEPRKLQAYLINKGFDPDIVKKVLRED